MEKKEATRLRVKRYRALHGSVTSSPDSVTKATENVTQSPNSVTLEEGEGVTKVGISPEDIRPDAWEKLHSFIQRGNNLEKLQRICGSLGGYAQGVWMGDLNLEDIGEVIGVKQGLYSK